MAKPGSLWAGLAMLLSGCGGPDFTMAATTREASNGPSGAAGAVSSADGGESPASGGASNTGGVGGGVGGGRALATGGAAGSTGGMTAAGGAYGATGGVTSSVGGDPAATSAGGYVGPSTGGIPHIGIAGVGGIGGAAAGVGFGGTATGGQHAGGAGGSTIPSICDTGDLCVTGRHCGTVQCLPSGATIDCSQYVVCAYSEYCPNPGNGAVCTSYFEGLGCNGPGPGTFRVCLVDTSSATACDDCLKEPVGRPGCIKTSTGDWRCASFLATP